MGGCHSQYYLCKPFTYRSLSCWTLDKYLNDVLTMNEQPLFIKKNYVLFIVFQVLVDVHADSSLLVAYGNFQLLDSISHQNCFLWGFAGCLSNALMNMWNGFPCCSCWGESVSPRPTRNGDRPFLFLFSFFQWRTWLVLPAILLLILFCFS